VAPSQHSPGEVVVLGHRIERRVHPPSVTPRRVRNEMRDRRRIALSDLPLLVSAGAVVVVIRLALWTIPSRVLLRKVDGMVARAPTPAGATPVVRRIGWAVRGISRYVPQASCLTQALATQVLLARRGYSSRLRIGVLNHPREGFAAHAWVEIDGEILVGERGAQRYRFLPELSPHLRNDR
jgi:hypothetical protein